LFNDTLKKGILTPVLKKKKDKTLPGNYRGIVVTNTFSKIIESVIKERLEKQLSPTQNPLQRGFTEHASSKFTAFIASETILIYKKINRDLELGADTVIFPIVAPSVLLVILSKIVLLYLL
jgi:retron-type reverse transcriptase